VAYIAVELNDALLLFILKRPRVDFSILSDKGERPVIVAVTLNNKEAIKIIWDF
jgi:hypothetical protein